MNGATIYQLNTIGLKMILDRLLVHDIPCRSITIHGNGIIFDLDIIFEKDKCLSNEYFFDCFLSEVKKVCNSLKVFKTPAPV